MSPFRIIIAGIGGVGGYFGGILAREYHDQKDIEIYFVARGDHLQCIRRQGLKVITPLGSFTAQPKMATDNPAMIGSVDCIVLSTKSYDLEQMIRATTPCVGPGTVLLPLLNGVDSVDRIHRILPEAKVWPGFAYIIARINEPGIIENVGNIQKVFFGSDQECTEEMHFLESLMKNAGIDATCTNEISKLMWEKFIFISPLASLTSFLDKNRGEIMENPQEMQLLSQLIDEVIEVAVAMNVNLHTDIRERTLKRLHSLTRDTTSSMHRDFQQKHRTELETLTGYVVEQSSKLHLESPAYEMIYEELKRREVNSQF